MIMKTNSKNTTQTIPELNMNNFMSEVLYHLCKLLPSMGQPGCAAQKSYAYLIS